MTVDMKIGSLNTRGGGNKLDQIIHTILKSKCHILMFQEMHEVDKNFKEKVEKLCDGVMFTNNGSTHSRGVATFVKNMENTRCLAVSNDTVGRKLIVRIMTGEESWHVINVYAPNDSGQRQEFFTEISKDIASIRERVILAGDFNCVLDRHLDRNKSDTKGAMRSDKSRDVLRHIEGAHDIVDTYRQLHPVGISYTFTGSAGYRARLDRVYMDSESANQLTSFSVTPVSYSDHDLVMATIGHSEQREKWGHGRWILNSKLLLDKGTTDEIVECIGYWRQQKSRFEDIFTWWDRLKTEIKGVFIRHGKQIQLETRKEVKRLEQELRMLAAREEVGERQTDRIRELKARLGEIEKEKIEAQQVRSKENWLDRKEKCSRYFFDQEKKRGGLKTISSVKDENGSILTSREGICGRVVEFYGKLLRAEEIEEEKLQRVINNHIDRKLTEVEKESIDGVITRDEIFKAVKEMKNHKSPGSDGLTREFYALMWKEIGNDLTDVMANISLAAKLPESWTEGLVTLIFKEKGDKNDLKNWRPITLLNCDYKIFTKTLSNRIRNVAGSLVNLDQSCGLPSRTIHDQLYFIRNYINYFQESNKSGLLVAIDQEKAFDRVNHKLILHMLSKFNFGSNLITLIKSIYQKMTSKVNINGMITESFPVTRSVRQGDGLSMVLFVLISELLSSMIRREMDIVPVSLPNSLSKKVAQYADDVSILTPNARSLNCLEKVIGKYEKLTGAKINSEKTEVLLIGRWSKKQKEKIPQKFRICIKNTVKILGVHFGKNAKNKDEEGLLKKIDTEIEKWQNRNLSMSGKIAVIRILMLSKIWHIAKVTGLSKTFICKLNSKLATFFWYPKKYRPVSLKTLQNEVSMGGLDFPNIETELQAYHLENVNISMTRPEKQWLGMFFFQYGKMLEKLIPRNKKMKYETQERRQNILTSDVLQKAMAKITNWTKTDFGKIRRAIRVNVDIKDNWGEGPEKLWPSIRNSSRNYKRMDLNYLVAHARLPVKNFLEKIKVTQNNQCVLCENEIETHEHLFWCCTKVQNLKGILEKDLCNGIGGKTNQTFKIIATHLPKMKPTVNELISIYKQTIWQVRAKCCHSELKDVENQLRSIYIGKAGKIVAKVPRKGVG